MNPQALLVVAVLASGFVTSCDKAKTTRDGRVLVTAIDCLLVPIKEKNHPHVNATNATHSLTNAVKLRSDLEAMSAEHRLDIGETLASLASHEGGISVPKGSRFRIVNRIDYDQALVGSWVFYECIHLESGTKSHYTLPKVPGEQALLIEKTAEQAGDGDGE